jgi:hypothetical protein
MFWRLTDWCGEQARGDGGPTPPQPPRRHDEEDEIWPPAELLRQRHDQVTALA